jgi:hypothetical protein
MVLHRPVQLERGLRVEVLLRHVWLWDEHGPIAGLLTQIQGSSAP